MSGGVVENAANGPFPGPKRKIGLLESRRNDAEASRRPKGCHEKCIFQGLRPPRRQAAGASVLRRFPQPSSAYASCRTGDSPVSLRQRLEARMMAPRLPRCRQRPLNVGLWDEDTRNQMELF